MAAPGSDFQQGNPPGAYPPGDYPPGVHPPGAHYAPQASTGDKGEIDLQRMPMPLGIPNCPPGLESLTQVNQLLVYQRVELVEAFIGFRTKNKFQIKNSRGQQIFFAAEENDCYTRNWSGNIRPFDMKIINSFGQEIMSLYRPMNCIGCCFPCCLQEIEVMAPPGQPIGYVIQTWHPYLPKFTVQNEKREPVLKIEGPCCTCRCGDVDFRITNLDETESVGKITKQWTGLLREALTIADNFGIQFPLDLDVKVKAVLLAATILIDYMFFENRNG
ncbi:phospholipid scramblase 1-like [Rhinoraja longicauda]